MSRSCFALHSKRFFRRASTTSTSVPPPPLWGVLPSALHSEFDVKVWRTRELLLQCIPSSCIEHVNHYCNVCLRFANYSKIVRFFAKYCKILHICLKWLHILTILLHLLDILTINCNHFQIFFKYFAKYCQLILKYCAKYCKLLRLGIQ